jgi:protein phosphatase/serine/threonine-protein phosphatase Stp1
MTRLRHAAATHVGRVRKINEDSLLALPDQKIWVVSDGMGGHEGGDFASQTIVECIAAIPAGLPPADRMRALRAAIIRAHETIVAEAAQRHRGVIGATVVAFMLADGHFVTFWSRC